ncbi:hypothetical protein [Salinibaculum salinum]|uniref:hypothetical protein n=1 Tax=Salinibaculum salinum TaxID=3131996 RepID=UPI0030ED9A91
MPSEAQGHGSMDRARYQKINDEIGEDPAQWLDKPLFKSPERNSTSAGWAIQHRIKSIDSFAVLGAWKGVERNLERGPRDRVMKMLNERAQELEDIGERPDRLQARDGRDVPEKEWYIVRDGERLSWSEVDRRGATVSFDTGSERAVTDGGENS